MKFLLPRDVLIDTLSLTLDVLVELVALRHVGVVSWSDRMTSLHT